MILKEDSSKRPESYPEDVEKWPSYPSTPLRPTDESLEEVSEQKELPPTGETLEADRAAANVTK